MMKSSTYILAMLILCALSAFTQAKDAAPADKPVQFGREILPVLSDRCFHCHGPDKQENDLRLDVRDSAVEVGAIEPGKPDESELIRRILSDDPDERMPPPKSGLTLTAEEKERLRTWIAAGAKYEQHWSFVPLPDAVPVPQVKDTRWPRGDLDRFVLGRLEAIRLKPSPEAEKERWLRRVTFDLTGLPPTLAEIDAFLADKSPEAYETVVTRLLASPHFGERMAVPWLDAARYADSYGYQSDQLSPTWPWRDWLVRALNDNLPFNEFITQQLAGDLLPEATRDQRLATAFNRLHRMTNEGGSISDEFQTEYVADRVQTLGTVFLGLTLECARCHDHKFDPITQKDFYRLFAFFNSIDEYGMYNDSARVPTPSLLLPNPDQEKVLKQLEQTVADRDADLNKAIAARQAAFDQWLASGPLSSGPLSSGPAKPDVPGLIAHYPLDKLEPGNKLANLANPKNPGSTSPANKIVPGKVGQALQLAGDHAAGFGGICGGLQPHDEFSLSLWIKLPKDLRMALIAHRSGGTDVGYHGAELSLKDGHLFFGIIRFWPGNAIAIQTRDELPADQWLHITLTYDASFSATGMHFYVNGKENTEIVRDRLYKYPGHGGTGLTFGERFRDRALKGAVLDEMKAYSRALTPVEAAQAFDGKALADAIAHRDQELLRPYYLANVDTEAAAARKQLLDARIALLKYTSSLPEIMVMEDMDEPRPAHVLARGQYDAPKTDKSRVQRGTPAALPPLPENAPRNRLGLAQWFTQPNHPLTARVAVNRFWQEFFGRGLVETSDNFGVQGSQPTHPELLDWLARDFVSHGWDVKRLCRQIVLSATYRQTSARAKGAADADPDNLLLSRGPSHRLSAETIRDTLLAASGLMDARLGGPPVSPYQPANLWRESNSMSPAYRQSVGTALYRRSLYTVWKRTAPMPNMLAFDAAGREVCSVRRQTTNTPAQALVLLNDIQFVEACRVLAERMLNEGGADDAARATFAFRLLTGRQPTPQELNLLNSVYTEQRAAFAKDPEGAAKLLTVGSRKANPKLNAVELAAATIVAQTIANLDAAIWKR